MAERERFIADWLAGGATNVAALCRQYQVSRKTGYKWLERFQQGGLAALADRSRAARSQPGRISPSIERRLVEARRAHPTWGPKKLRAWLARREADVAWPAPSTIGEALKRAGLVREQRRPRRLSNMVSPLKPPERANELWAIDYKGQFRTGDGVLCFPLTITDAHSRYLLGCEAHARPCHDEARNSVERLFRERGLPERMRSDNGSPFASAGAGRLSRLNVWWLKLGIAVEQIEPGKPQQNGCHERMHRTLKAETARPPAADACSQQACFDRFRTEFNDERPHEALGLRPPASLYEAPQRSYPAVLEDPDYPGHWERRRVRRDGSVKFQGALYFLSEALAGELTGWVEVEDDIWQICFASAEIALYDAANLRVWPIAKSAKRPRGAA